MPDIFVLLREYIDFYPLVAFISLILAGLNIPISEDLIIITGALISYGKRANLIYNLLAIYAGVIVSDFFVYWVGTRVRKGAAGSKWFSRMVPEKALKKTHYYLDKYGIFTFIIGRFIPFGVRNALFFTSGMFNLRFRLFAFYDIVAALISTNTLFFLTFHFGEDAHKPIKIAGIILFAGAVLLIATLIIRFAVLLRKKKLLKASQKTAAETD